MKNMILIAVGALALSGCQSASNSTATNASTATNDADTEVIEVPDESADANAQDVEDVADESGNGAMNATDTPARKR